MLNKLKKKKSLRNIIQYIHSIIQFSCKVVFNLNEKMHVPEIEKQRKDNSRYMYLWIVKSGPKTRSHLDITSTDFWYLIFVLILKLVFVHCAVGKGHCISGIIGDSRVSGKCRSNWIPRDT